MHPILIVVLLVIGLFFYLLTLRNGQDAPYVPLSPKVIERILLISEISKKDVFYDLGSGDGRLVIAAAMKGAKAHGVEKNIFRVLYSRLMIRMFGLSKNAKIIHGNLFKINLKDATIVHAYLLQDTNNKLEKKLKKELKKGTKVISSGFEFKKLKLVRKDMLGPIYGPLRMYKI